MISLRTRTATRLNNTEWRTRYFKSVEPCCSVWPPPKRERTKYEKSFMCYSLGFRRFRRLWPEIKDDVNRIHMKRSLSKALRQRKKRDRREAELRWVKMHRANPKL